MDPAMIHHRPTWHSRSPVPIKVNPDKTVSFKAPIGDVALPAAYLSFMQETDGFTVRGDDSWFVTKYKSGPKTLQLLGLSGFFAALDHTWRYQHNPYHDARVVPKGYVGIGQCEGDVYPTDVLLCCDPGHADDGKVFTWMQSQHPWMTGDNTRGLGLAANNLTDLLNNLSRREALSH
jgi:hypothetical protein